jgi:hypothetical protein
MVVTEAAVQHVGTDVSFIIAEYVRYDGPERFGERIKANAKGTWKGHMVAMVSTLWWIKVEGIGKVYIHIDDIGDPETVRVRITEAGTSRNEVMTVAELWDWMCGKDSPAINSMLDSKVEHAAALQADMRTRYMQSLPR